MTISSALYYPHTALTDKNLIKNSLLLWDKVEYITPAKKWKHSSLNSKPFDEAIEIITEPHFPSPEERQKVHERVKNLLGLGLPKSFFLDELPNDIDKNTYAIYPQKLDHITWRMLEEQNLVRLDGMDDDYHGTPFWGLLLMSLLAEACAGDLKRKITDRTEAYSWLQKSFTAEAGGEFVTGKDVNKILSAQERLVTISIKLLDTDNIPVRSLVAMRKREAKSSSTDYREFRMKYLNKVDQYVDAIIKPGLREVDIQELERQFQKDMEQEISELRIELNLAKNKLLFSKEVGVAAAAVSGAFVTPGVGFTTLLSTVGVGALYRLRQEFKAAKRKAMKSNSMSWLYLNNKHANRFDPLKIII